MKRVDQSLRGCGKPVGRGFGRQRLNSKHAKDAHSAKCGGANLLVVDFRGKDYHVELKNNNKNSVLAKTKPTQKRSVHVRNEERGLKSSSRAPKRPRCKGETAHACSSRGASVELPELVSEKVSSWFYNS